MRLLIVADDFTGALDTGAQFARWDCTCLVSGQLSARADVVVVDTDTRHQAAGPAYRTVFELVREARALGFTHFFKKTDSVMRGNIGSELKAFQDALACPDLPFMPAYPENGRTTRQGCQYVQGVPVAESAFGRDPFDPVRHSRIADIIAEQADPRGIRVIDAETADDMLNAASKLDLHVLAGCAGLAGHLPGLLGFCRRSGESRLPEAEYAVVSGSIHPLALKQLEMARQAGFPMRVLSESQKKGLAVFEAPAFRNRLILAAADRPDDLLSLDDPAMRRRIVHLLGLAAAGYVRAGKIAVVIGGDTMRELVAVLGWPDLTPVRELLPGTVLSQSSDGLYTFISKSGGFGGPDVLLAIDRLLGGSDS